MFLYDSAKRDKVKFIPNNEGIANIYLCGPTVYDDAHLGHARSAISFDLLRRVLIEIGYEVKFVRNFTDIDDKIIDKMFKTNQSLKEITTHYINRYLQDMNALNVMEADISPKATECIDDMIKIIQNLIKNNIAYTLKDDGVYFDTNKDPKYLNLSKRDSCEQTQARVTSNELKRNEKDFVLWKFDKDWYEAPFGTGRPGWHTECVAMIKKHFNNNNDDFYIDIHAGGVDLLFPHHENEATQCRCNEHKELSKYWMHNGFININGEKMSKSLNNSFFVKDALKIYHGEVLRFYILTTHYRAHFNYSTSDLESAKKRLDKLYRLKKRLYMIKPSNNCDESFKKELLDSLKDDLNTSKALATIDEMIKVANEKLDLEPKNKSLKEMLVKNIELIQKVIGVGCCDAFNYFQHGITQEQKDKIDELILKRQEAKSKKDFATADLIRDELSKQSISIMDTPNGTFWEKI